MVKVHIGYRNGFYKGKGNICSITVRQNLSLITFLNVVQLLLISVFKKIIKRRDIANQINVLNKNNVYSEKHRHASARIHRNTYTHIYLYRVTEK